MNTNEPDYHHAGMTVHSNYTSYIPNTTTVEAASTNRNSHSPYPTDKQQHQQQPQQQQQQQQQPQQQQQQQQEQQEQQEQESNQPRKRTRASPEQLAILEKTFSVNPSPNNRVREQLSRDLCMSGRSIQIWFQNRRAKVKNMAKRSSLMHDETMRMQYYAATAAAAACQAAGSQQQHTSPDGTPVSNTDLYYYYYYYYYNQQQQHGIYGADGTSISPSTHLKSTNQSTPPPPPPMPGTSSDIHRPWTSLSTPPPSSSSSKPLSIYHHHYHQQQQQQQQAQRLRLSPSSSSSPTSAIAISTAGGRIRSHSVGHYPYNPYQRHGSRPGSSEPTSGYSHRRQHSSTSPAPSALPMHMWSSSPSSALMLSPNDMIPEEAATTTAPTPTTIDTTGYISDWSPDAAINDQSTFSLPMSFVQGAPMSMGDYGNNSVDDRTNHYRISGEALQIGSWKRISLQPQDLECHYDRQLRCMVWKIRDGQQQFKMHIMMESIEKVQLDPLAERLGWARLSLTVNQPEMINFYMEEGSGTGGGGTWIQCRDFTQDKQATTVPTHYIDGPALALRAEWMRLVGQDQHLLDLFQNNMLQPTHQVSDPSQLYHTSHGPHGQSMLSNSTPSREVTPADMMMVLQQDDNQQPMLSLMEKSQGAQDLLLFQGV